MDIKLIAIDLDGTLLDSLKHVSERNLSVLTECIERGIYVVPATGRTSDGLPDEVKSIPGVRYAILTNGAAIKDLRDNRLLDSRNLTYQTALKLMTMASHGRHIMYDSYINGRGVSEARFMNHMQEYGITPQVQELVKRTRDIVPDILRYVEEEKPEVEKVNMFFSREEDRLQMREELKSVPEIVVSSSMPNNLEINASGATKGEGILRLAERLGLKQEQTMAIGDGENDYDMIRLAGLGVAMSNGEQGLKESADYVTCSNDEDGVAAAIEKLIFKRE